MGAIGTCNLTHRLEGSSSYFPLGYGASESRMSYWPDLRPRSSKSMPLEVHSVLSGAKLEVRAAHNWRENVKKCEDAE